MKYNELLEKYPQLKTYENAIPRICEPWIMKRLNKCHAWYGIQHGAENIVILRSYQTVIAVYDKQENIVYDFLRAVYGYTSTSCQHITKFADKMRFLFNKPGIVRDYPHIIRIND